jgi:outer membrane lipoprotein-sorting protein
MPIQLMRRREYKTVLLLLLPALSGCLVHTRTIKQAKMPSVVMTATAEELVQAVNKQCQAINSLSATVEFQATEGGPRKGKEKTYTSFTGYILLRKPEAVRVIGLVPVLHTRAFDMASDGNTFKLLIYYPHNRVIEGSNTVTKEAANPLENLRPKIFFDSLLIKCIQPDDLVTLTTDTETKMDPKSKQLMIYPEYDLTVVRQKANTQELIPQRVIHFSRIDLHTVQEDIYDQKGAIQTQAIYGPMQKFGPQSFPGTITIKRPLEEYQIAMTLQKLNVNLTLTDDQFDIKIPEGTVVTKLE